LVAPRNPMVAFSPLGCRRTDAVAMLPPSAADMLPIQDRARPHHNTANYAGELPGLDTITKTSTGGIIIPIQMISKSALLRGIRSAQIAIALNLICAPSAALRR
jgi:hypothetical protein